jgi:hypothetical protein
MKQLSMLFYLMLIFLGIHTGIAIAPGGRLLVPFALSGIGAVGILMSGIGWLSRKTLQLSFLLIGCLAVMAFFTSLSDNALPQHLISSFLFLYSIVVAAATFWGLSMVRLTRLRMFFLTAAVILIVGSALEVYGPLKPISDEFRSAANNWRSQDLYVSDSRDIFQYGGMRPKFFATEPSILGITIGYSILFFFLSSRKYNLLSLGAAAALTGIAFFIVRSPTIVICWLAAVMFYVAELGARQTVPFARVLCLSILALSGILYVPGIVASSTNYGRTGSYFVRELGPVLVAGEVVRTHPLFGVGFGGATGMVSSIINAYSGPSAGQHGDVLQQALTDPLVARKLITNQFWEYWADLGLLGGVLILVLLWRILGNFSVPNRLLVFSSGALIMTNAGGVPDPTIWVGIFSIAALYKSHTDARFSEGPETAAIPNSALTPTTN